MTEGRFDGICELVLESRDLAAMVDFYERLGLTILSRDTGRVWLSAGSGGRIGIWTPGAKEHRDRGGSHVHFALSASREHLQALEEDLRRVDPDFEGPVEHEGGDRSIYVFDPEGNRVELWDYFHEPGAPDAGVVTRAGSSCPSCGTSLAPPDERSGSLEDKLECPGCKRPLTWFVDDHAAGRWILDEAEAGRRRMAEGPGDVDPPAPA